MAKLYNSFRVNITRRLGGGFGFFALTEMKLFSGENGAGNQLLLGGTATASSFFGSGFEASKAFDDNTGTRWASNNSGSTAWIKYDLIVGVEKPKSIYLLLNNAPDNAPVDFVLQASTNNGLTWEYIYTAIDFATSSEFTSGIIRSLLQKGLTGKATINGAMKAHRVIVYDWFTGALIQSVSPDAFGDWVFVDPKTATDKRYLIVVTAEDDVFNVRPQAHGPVTAKPLE